MNDIKVIRNAYFVLVLRFDSIVGPRNWTCDGFYRCWFG